MILNITMLSIKAEIMMETYLDGTYLELSIEDCGVLLRLEGWDRGSAVKGGVTTDIWFDKQMLSEMNEAIEKNKDAINKKIVKANLHSEIKIDLV